MQIYAELSYRSAEPVVLKADGSNDVIHFLLSPLSFWRSLLDGLEILINRMQKCITYT